MTQTLAAAPLQSQRQQLTEGRLRAFEHYEAQRDPQVLFAALTDLVDLHISALWQAASGDHSAALVAVGGYGRGHLFPYSDIDLLILLPEVAPESLLKAVESFVGQLWDLGLEVGHSVRSVPECLEEAERDITVATNLLENRLICGSAELYRQMVSRLNQERDAVSFVEGKQLEQQQRHLRFFGVTNNLEPNIKESPGGLRDLHTLLWISKAIGLGDSWEKLAEKVS